MKIDGLKIKNYRSFDEGGITISDLGKVNIFIGKNNSGKSNLLRFISDLYPVINHNSNMPPFSDDDYYDHDNRREIKWSLQYKQNSTLKKLLTRSQAINDILVNQDSIWMEYGPVLQDRTRYDKLKSNFDWFEKLVPSNPIELTKLRNELLPGTSLSNLTQIQEGIFNSLILSKQYVEDKIYLITNYRRIEKNNQFDSSKPDYFQHIYNGTNLIRELNKMKNPLAKESKKEKEKFNKIQDFVRSISGLPDAEIHISNDESELSLSSNGRQIKIENLGTGIHQLLILAISVTIVNDAIFCIEEPEIFLHPQIQKKFINYLQSTDNQYFISTHSNSLINSPNIEVYHVINNGTKSVVNKLLQSAEKNEMLNDLGYHASDLLQSNYILWVEGPSDRIYLNHWINATDNSLKEGIEYSIMFYGGRLLSHLSVEDHTVDDFIKLNRINRHVGILIDSDKSKKDEKINGTKTRIVAEFENLKYFTWVTEGREIENYISSTTLKESIGSITGKNAITVESGQFAKVTVYKDENQKMEIDKVSLAKEVAKRAPDFSIFNLNKKITELVSIIKKANGK